MFVPRTERCSRIKIDVCFVGICDFDRSALAIDGSADGADNKFATVTHAACFGRFAVKIFTAWILRFGVLPNIDRRIALDQRTVRKHLRRCTQSGKQGYLEIERSRLVAGQVDRHDLVGRGNKGFTLVADAVHIKFHKVNSRGKVKRTGVVFGGTGAAHGNSKIAKR